MAWFRCVLALIAGCEPSASSPPEHADAKGPSDTTSPCLAAEFPILFHSTRATQSLQPQLFAMRADGSEAVRIAHGGSFYGAVWAPDGRRIAYRRQSAPSESATPRTEIGLLSPSGLERLALLVDENPLITSVAYHRPDGPSWSADGERIAFASLTDMGQFALWVVSSAAGEPERLLPDLDVPHADASFAPQDRDGLAYVATVEGVQDVWTAQLSEPVEHRNLTQGRVHLPRSPRWSRDGTTIAFSASPSAARAEIEEVYVLDLATSELVRVTEDEAFGAGPAWSPDGRSLLIGSSRGDSGSNSAQNVQLWQVWLDGSEAPRQRTPNLGMNFGADWYPESGCGDDD